MNENDEGENKQYQKARLSDSDVRSIRRRCAEIDSTQRRIAEDYGVSAPYISVLARGGARREAGGPIKGEDYESAKNTLDVERMRELYESGLDLRSVGERMGCSHEWVRQKLLDLDVEMNHRGSHRKFDEEDVLGMRKKHAKGHASIDDIAKEYDISTGYVRLVLRGQSYDDCSGPLLGTDYEEYGEWEAN